MADEQLTLAQQAAVDNRGGPLLVSAAAGSGKTKVLVDRLMAYLTDPRHPANVDEFLIITYTKAAASELRGKIAAALTQRLSREPGNRHLQRQLQRLYLAKISTVHAFCADLLREYAFPLGLPPDARVADEGEAVALREAAMETVLQAAYARIGQSPALQAFVDTQGFGRDDRAVPEIILAVYESARCHVQPEAWLRRWTQAGQEAQDVAETPWGAFLAEQLRQYARAQAENLEKAYGLAMGQPDLKEKYAPTLLENRRQLLALAESRTWGEIQENRISDFGRLKVVRNPEDPEVAGRIKALRKAAYDGVKARQRPFATSPDKLLADMADTAPAVQGLVELVMDFAQAYRLEKRRRRVLDFGDLEHETLALLLGRGLTGPTRAAGEVGSRFREVMVDEYQDTNQVQDRIFSALTAQRGNCFMVGDVKQSIYRFRLADPGIFLEKYQSYLPAEEAALGQGRKILLSENFRSGPEILSAANAVFRQAMCPQVGGLYYGPEEALRPGIPRDPLPGAAVEFHAISVSGEKYPAEAGFVARRMAQMLAEPAMVRQGDGLRPVRPGDMVILLRSPGTCARYYVEALGAAGIPCVTDSGVSVLAAGEISILRALLQVLDNPLQDIPLEAVLLSPVFGFSADRLGEIRAKEKQGPLLYALEKDGSEQAADFLALLDRLRQVARLEPVDRLMDEIYLTTHIEDLFSAMPDGEQRRRNLEFFHETAVDFAKSGRNDLAQFLTYLDRLEARGLRREEERGGGDAVRILSIHKSKGLEYPVVFLCNLSGRFNREDLRGNVLVDPALGIGCSVLDRENRCRYPSLAKQAIAQRIQTENVSEELRVLYVAMTRARDRLVMTYATKYLDKRLEEMAAQVGGNFTLSQEADCPGHWVLMAAMTRTEAGALFQVGGRPAETAVSQYPWRIAYHQLGGEETPAAAPQAAAPALPDLDTLDKLLAAPYSHAAAVLAPAKVTATQLKGRQVDQEAAEGAPPPPRPRQWRLPDFLSSRPLTGREIGTATHLAMQFIRYPACTSLGAVEEELARLTREEYLTPRQAQAVNRRWILRFFQTQLGRRLQGEARLLREFKFSLLEDGSLLDTNLAGEQVLLQGVVDCCLAEADGLTILDFKTDRVSPGGEGEAAAKYAPQVRAYGRAMGRMFAQPVKALLLYFFQTGTFAQVPPEEQPEKKE